VYPVSAEEQRFICIERAKERTRPSSWSRLLVPPEEYDDLKTVFLRRRGLPFACGL
jgi:hypothetical protein